MESGVDPGLMRDWLTGWTRARRTSAPVAQRDHWFVDVGWPEQKRRYVFCSPSPEIAGLAQAIDEPWVFLKGCMSDQAMAALLPAGWTLTPSRFMMTCEVLTPSQPVLPPGYRLQTDIGAPVPSAAILDGFGELAAAGQIVWVENRAIFDSIKVDIGHRRRGLGRALVQCLTKMALDMGAKQGLLVSTQEGRALYESLGWRFHAPYASAMRDIQRVKQEAGLCRPR
jgi:GNAT superfamily N-acetyltransferase